MSSIGRAAVKPMMASAQAARFQYQRRTATSAGTAQASSNSENKSRPSNDAADKKVEDIKQKKKTMAQLDEEMRLAMEGISGEGGEHGAELEDGKPVAMKRSVKENMFRVI